MVGVSPSGMCGISADRAPGNSEAVAGSNPAYTANFALSYSGFILPATHERGGFFIAQNIDSLPFAFPCENIFKIYW